MKKEIFSRLVLACLFFSISTNNFGQTRGDLAFTSYNVDGNEGFSIALLIDLPINTTIYFTDYDWDEHTTSFVETGNDGFIIWNSGSEILKAGTIVLFNETDNSSNSEFGVSKGTLTSPENTALLSTGETLFMYLGTNKDSPTLFLTGFKNDKLNIDELTGTGLGGTDLVAGIDFLELNIPNAATSTPDGGAFNGSRTNKTNYSEYLSSIVNKTNWDYSTSNGEDFSPISSEAFTINSTKWTGAISANWTLTANWDNGTPTADTQVTIPITANTPIIDISSSVQTGNIELEAGAGLTINGNLINKGSITVHSGGSIIAANATSYDITYKRVLSENWHLISSPVSNQSIHSFITSKALLNDLEESGINYGIAPYNNNGLAWEYITTSNIDSSDDFIVGKGYSVLKKSTGNITFRGSIPATNITTTIQSGSSNNWNLIGNPFPSHIPANINAQVTENFISKNSTKLNAAYQAIYFWDGSSYIPINQASSARYIAPCQGFFVNSVSGGATIDFSTTLQSHQSSEVFNKTSASTPEVTLFISNEKSTKKTTIKYLPNTTTGLDPGYDAGQFSALVDSFNIYSHLASNSNGIDFSIQAVPDNDYENITIPIGVDIENQNEYTFTINKKNFPENLMIFLEDTIKQTVTRLDEDSNSYKVVLDSLSGGVGQFYIRTSAFDISKTLNVSGNSINNITVSATIKNTIKISNNNEKNTLLTIYNVLGTQVYQTILNPKPINNLKIPHHISRGIYIIQLNTNKGVLRKKLYIK